MSKKANDLLVLQMETEEKRSKIDLEERFKQLEQQLVDSRNKDTKEKDSSITEISTLRQALEMSKKENELLALQMETEVKRSKIDLEEKIKELEQQLADSRNTKEKDSYITEISTLRQSLEMSKKANELLTLQMETEVKRATVSFVERIKELEQLLTDSINRDSMEKDSSTTEIWTLKQSFEMAKKSNELLTLQLETEAKRSKAAHEEQVKELEQQLVNLRNKDIKEKDSLSMETSTLKQSLEIAFGKRQFGGASHLFRHHLPSQAVHRICIKL